MIITICIGSSCHLKGSREVISQLETLIKERHLENLVELNGSFCMGHCVNGVSVKIDGELFSLKPEKTTDFFNTEVLGRLNQ